MANQTHFSIQFDTGDVNVIFDAADRSPNNRDKATVIGYIMRNIGLALTVMSKFNMFGIPYRYQLPSDIPAKLKIIGKFTATAQVNDWDITLVNDDKYKLTYTLKSTEQLTELFE
ncbi:hypothetical protein F-M6_0481 [Faustovirus]|nr:hypothetical protein F-M6_0481 [Faustovirus]QJX74249.1 hypothetical protein F-E9_496 [Faustovirus]